MTLKAVLLDQRPCLRAAPVWLGYDGRVGSIVSKGDQLDENKDSCRGSQQDHYDLFFAHTHSL
jgi:hypothetical protein